MQLCFEFSLKFIVCTKKKKKKIQFTYYVCWVFSCIVLTAHSLYFYEHLIFHCLFPELIRDVQFVILNSILLFICSSSRQTGMKKGEGGGLKIVGQSYEYIMTVAIFQRNPQICTIDEMVMYFSVYFSNWSFVVAVLMFFSAIMHWLSFLWHNFLMDWF